MKATRIHWASVAQFGLSTLVIINLWMGALIITFMGLTDRFYQAYAPNKDPLPILLMATVAFVSGVLLIPSAYYALWRLLGWRSLDIIPHLKRLRPVLWILAFPILLLLGNWVSNYSSLSYLALPVINLLAIGLPISWILYIAVRGLPLGSPQRSWGLFGSGLILAPALIMIAEAVAGVVFLSFVLYYFLIHPDRAIEISKLAYWVTSSNSSLEVILEKIGPYIIMPSVIFLVMIFSAVVVPLIEELLKPIGVWLLAGRKLPPAAGFAAGAICGAAYAFIESLVLTSNDQQWTSMMVARIGTSVIHIFNSALVGWAIVQTWGRNRYKVFFLSSFAAICIHGLWNALIISASFTTLASQLGLEVKIPGFSHLSQAAPLGLLLLTIGVFTLLIYSNRSLFHDSRSTEIDHSLEDRCKDQCDKESGFSST